MNEHLKDKLSRVISAGLVSYPIFETMDPNQHAYLRCDAFSGSAQGKKTLYIGRTWMEIGDRIGQVYRNFNHSNVIFKVGAKELQVHCTTAVYDLTKEILAVMTENDKSLLNHACVEYSGSIKDMFKRIFRKYVLIKTQACIVPKNQGDGCIFREVILSKCTVNRNEINENFETFQFTSTII